MPEMKLPGPDHPITIAPHAGKVTVRFGGEVIAETSRALELKEASYPPVLYIPREDARMEKLARTDHTTYCPYKGDCNYFGIQAGGQQAENAVWTYESPYPAVAPIDAHLAFYPNKVQITG
ncbi:DUF427 domain-containing protein [Siccirubricoccus phaeus]|uniref:DUF427 domain-containing protein n=1 Tax=Siccirubricoccus phaeus TaxID=2595053 RepID=UPI0011F36D5B|nr:DUF427 domain-containing protein [Siccirubricoccus phaeus]